MFRILIQAYAEDRGLGGLNQGATDEQRIGLITEVLDEAGITTPPPREPLPDIEKHKVRLVTWMAVKGTRGQEEAFGQIPGTKLPGEFSDGFRLASLGR